MYFEQNLCFSINDTGALEAAAEEISAKTRLLGGEHLSD